jgi:hypothetical protein
VLSADAVVSRLNRWPVTLLPEAQSVSPEELIARYPDTRIVACDFYVTGAENGEAIPSGFRLGPIDNVDHHAPVPSMRRAISSANLAIRHVDAFGALEGAGPVVIHHTDCDSVLSSSIVQGILLPDLRFGSAAIAADHTGQENAIADLLQSMERYRDLELSLVALARLMSGEPLPIEAAVALQQRMEERRIAERAVEAGEFRWSGSVAYAEIDHSLDTAFLPPLLPEAKVVMVARPTGDEALPWKIKLRLGLAAPEGASILDIGLTDFDPSFGGRWNAGSNRRAGGTSIPPEEYAEFLNAATSKWR